MDEITQCGIGVDLSKCSYDEMFQVSRQDLQSMLAEAYLQGKRDGINTGY